VITLKGDLVGMLSAARDTKRSPDTGDLMVQTKLVAGLATRWIWSSPGLQLKRLWIKTRLLG
jgi:hypothetical protein